MAKLSIVNAIPKMTSDTAPSGVASASSVYSTTYNAWKAFDGDITTSNSYWETNATTGEHTLAYKFQNPIVIGAYALTSRLNYPTQAPKDWFFEGSNDDSTWVTLDTKTNITDWSSRINKYELQNTTKYSSYRVRITANNGASNNKISLAELEMFELLFEKRAIIKNSTTSKIYSLDSKTLIHLPSSSDKNMILHGIESGKEIKLDEDFNKMKYVKDTSEVLGSGKVFTHVVDMSNTKVKKIIL